VSLDVDAPPGFAVALRPNGTPRQIRVRSSYRSESLTTRPALDAARAFLRENHRLLKIDDPDRELVPTSRAFDDLGGLQLRFDQVWQGITVWPSEVIVHLDAAGNVELVDGALVPTPRRLPRVPTIGPDAAIAAARGTCATDSIAEGTSVSVPELIIHTRGGRRVRLAWKTSVSLSLTEQWTVITDAMNGAVLQRFNNVPSSDVAGSGRDLGGVTRQLRVWKDGAVYTLLDASKSMYDPASQPPSPQTTRGGIFVGDFTHGERTLNAVISPSPTTWSVPDSVSAAFWLAETYDYFLERHGRNSIDGEKGTLMGAVRYKSAYSNAFWVDDQQLMVFGDGDTFAGSLDVIAHEMSHGVTAHTANLVYEGQSGALNEALSDIFGEMAEAHFYGTNDWLLGTQTSSPIRSMSNPARFGHPAKMSAFVHLGSDEDHGGVHTNSGIINHAFYQLAEGLPGAVGRRDAERIFYRALTQHLTRDSQFIDARIAAITSAEELFGAASAQARKTAEAFDKVEIFAAAQSPEPLPIPVVNGVDATLFLFRQDGDWHLGRRDSQDPDAGVGMGTNAVAETRAAVTGDGTLAVYVDPDRDACLVFTDASGRECLGLDDAGLEVSSVGMAPDASKFGFVLYGEDEEPEGRIIVYDFATDVATPYDLTTPVFDGDAISSVRFADVMSFTADGRFLIYDALNEVDTNGSPWSAWSIYALDLETGKIFAIVPAIEGLDIGYPALGHTSDDLITFEAYDAETDDVRVFAASLDDGSIDTIASDKSIPMVPGYTGDDRAIVYAMRDSNGTGASLMRRALEPDHITPSGAAVRWLSDAAYGVIYRRGTYSGPTTTPGKASFTSPTYAVNEGSTTTVAVVRAGGNKGAFTVSYKTANGSAASGDYTPASGILSWADGEDGVKTFLVHAAADATTESAETVQLSISGASVATPAAATLTIVNQDIEKTGRRRSVRH